MKIRRMQQRLKNTNYVCRTTASIDLSNFSVMKSGESLNRCYRIERSEFNIKHLRYITIIPSIDRLGILPRFTCDSVCESRS